MNEEEKSAVYNAIMKLARAVDDGSFYDVYDDVAHILFPLIAEPPKEETPCGKPPTTDRMGV